MDGLEASPLGGTALLEQNALVKSLWSDMTPLDSNTSLTNALTAIRSPASRGTSISELKPRSASDLSLNQTLDMPEADNGASVETSEAVLSRSNLSSQPTIVRPATSKSDHQTKAASDSLTGITESAPLVGAQATTQDIMIDFQPDTATVPTEYIKDVGEAYSDTRGFGWVRQDSLSSPTHTPLDITSNARDRNWAEIDPKLNTLLHMQYPDDIPNPTAVKVPAAWESALPNGNYNVTVSVGDPSYYNSQHTINVEGVKAIDRFQSTPEQKFQQATVKATVTDGRLTIDAIGGTNAKINYIEIESMASDTLLANKTSLIGNTSRDYKTSWIGNTFSGGDKWVQNFVEAMYVAPDGTVYTNSEWDEAGREAGIYRDEDVIGSLEATHGWGRTGGEAVTGNGKYIYIGMQQKPEGKPGEDYPPSGTEWYGVRRYNLSGEPAPFPGGRGYDESILIVSRSSSVTGLASTGSELYVSDNAANRIRVYNTETMVELRSWSFTRPDQLTVDQQGNLWIIQAGSAGNAPKILHYSKTGKLLSEKITDITDPTALEVDNQGRLLVAENGSRQQVLIYDVTATPTLFATLGTKGGIYSGTRGEVGDLKFYGLTGVGTDAKGNIYVSLNGFNGSGTDLRKFSPAGDLQWKLQGLEFLDSADADPGTNGVDVFTKQEHFVMDYGKSKGQEWNYKGYTLDPFRYPDDPRLHTSLTSPFVRRIRGQRFLYLTDMYAERLNVYRFDGEIAVPSAIFARGHTDWPTNQPATGSWFWRDLNGNGAIESDEYKSLETNRYGWGWEVDSKGDIWQTSDSGIHHYSVQGLDAYGSPIYTEAASREISTPAPFDQLERIKYFPDTDTMYLGGFAADRPNTGNVWGIVGTEIVRYDNWSTTRNVRWRTKLPYDSNADPILITKAMDVAGDRVFAVTSREAEVYVYDAATGASVTKFTPGPEVKGESGWIDIPYGIRAYQRSNGEYVVFVEEDWKGKVIMYRLAPSVKQ